MAKKKKLQRIIIPKSSSVKNKELHTWIAVNKRSDNSWDVVHWYNGGTHADGPYNYKTKTAALKKAKSLSKY